MLQQMHVFVMRIVFLLGAIGVVACGPAEYASESTGLGVNTDPILVQTYAQQAYVKASNPGMGDLFGLSIAISEDGNTLAVGALLEGSSATGINGNQADDSAVVSGAVYVYTRVAGEWTQQAYIKASNTGIGDTFGTVALSADGNTLAVGAAGEGSDAIGVNGDQMNDNAMISGAVYIFTRSGGIWSQQAYIKASNTNGNDSFGAALALSSDGNTLAVGAPGEDSNAIGINGNQTNNGANEAGAAYVFTRSGAVWTQQAYVKASNTQASDQFGITIALSGDGNTLAVGAFGEDSNATGINGNQANNAAPLSGAAYVFARSGTVWAQQAYVKASNTDAEDGFGAVSLSGDGNTLAVGALGEDSSAVGINGNQANNAAVDSGAVYVYVRTSGVWSLAAYVKASNSEAGDRFGHPKLSSDGTVLTAKSDEGSNATGVNGSQADNSAPLAGALFVFRRSSGIWAQSDYVKASNTGAGDGFGISAVSSDGSTIAVSAYIEDSGATGVNGNQVDESMSGAGAVYVFAGVTVPTFEQQAYVKASNTQSNDLFGADLVISGDGNTMAIAAMDEDSNATGVNGDQNNNSAANSGAVYIFVRSGNTWTQQAYLKASNTGAGDRFGYVLALSSDGNTLAVGALLEDSNSTGINGVQANNSASDSGAVYVFTRSGTTWTQQAYIKASNTGAGDRFGAAVAMSSNGNTLSVGAPREDSNATGVNGNQSNELATDSGAVYVFTRSGTTWSQQAYVKASNTGATDNFHFVGLSGDGNTLAVGSAGEDSNATLVNGTQANEAAANSGAVYVFTRSGSTWSQQAYIKASNTEAEDAFGSTLVLSSDGNTLGISAYKEDGGSVGANGNQNDNSAPDSGAVYVYMRSSGLWTHQAYLKAFNAGAGDEFGAGTMGISADGDTLAVTAWREDSNATGLNGNQADNSATDSGAAYVFSRSSGQWSPREYVKASNTDAGDHFGHNLSLAADGATLVVTAAHEDSNAIGVNGDGSNNSAASSGAVYTFMR